MIHERDKKLPNITVEILLYFNHKIW